MTFHNSGLNASFLHPSVGQPGEEEVPEVEGQLDHHSENANHVDQKPAIIWSATETDHFQSYLGVSGKLGLEWGISRKQSTGALSCDWRCGASE